MSRLLLVVLFVCSVFCSYTAGADQRSDPREQALSSTLDLWREGHFEQLYDSLSHRGGMTRERFVQTMKETTARPACCFNKLSEFRLISEKRTTAKVFAKVGMENTVGSEGSQSRELTLDHEEGRWKLRMADLKGLAGFSKKKNSRSTQSNKYYH